jgi:hypothetical protein
MRIELPPKSKMSELDRKYGPDAGVVVLTPSNAPVFKAEPNQAASLGGVPIGRLSSPSSSFSGGLCASRSGGPCA